ncbi:MAG: DNA-3-methyladenine glycosylase 2 family protein [Clostridiales bacterium]|nr:DNA-3-methyladenine glycosylase 2 family protein [Clostridiales bacterium]
MTDVEYFRYGKKETEHLKERDPALGVAIERIGLVRREVIPDLFTALVHSIVGQQISSKAQKTVWGRICEKVDSITPESLYHISIEDLQSCGISLRKADYIKKLAEEVYRGRLDLAALQTESDEAVCRRLCELKGVGAWTAEMLMIFSMQRPNIISRGDFGILKGLRMLYHHREITDELFYEYRQRYSPYATVASLYLWEIAGGACPELIDPALEKERIK